jgi:hypothetical protein
VTPLIKTASLTEDAFAISHVERGGVLWGERSRFN